MTSKNTIAVTTLKGEENLEDWQVSLMDFLSLQRLELYITQHIPEPIDDEELEKWRYDRLNILIAIRESTTPVHKILKNYGWNPMKDRDPKAFYELILRAIPKASEDVIADLVLDWNTQKPTSTLGDYVENAVTLRRRLGELGIRFDDRVATLTVLAPLRNVNETWYSQMLYDYHNGNLS
jgi:hypothetical protein